MQIKHDKTLLQVLWMAYKNWGKRSDFLKNVFEGYGWVCYIYNEDSGNGNQEC